MSKKLPRFQEKQLRCLLTCFAKYKKACFESIHRKLDVVHYTSCAYVDLFIC